MNPHYLEILKNFKRSPYEPTDPREKEGVESTIEFETIDAVEIPNIGKMADNEVANHERYNGREYTGEEKVGFGMQLHEKLESQPRRKTVTIVAACHAAHILISFLMEESAECDHILHLPSSTVR